MSIVVSNKRLVDVFQEQAWVVAAEEVSDCIVLYVTSRGPILAVFGTEEQVKAVAADPKNITQLGCTWDLRLGSLERTHPAVYGSVLQDWQKRMGSRDFAYWLGRILKKAEKLHRRHGRRTMRLSRKDSVYA